MIFTEADLDRFSSAVRVELLHRGAGRFVERVARRRRDRLGPLADAVRDQLAPHRMTMATEAGREELEDQVCEALRTRRQEFGVPVWVFAIILKVLASVIIDMILLQSQEGA
jgi:hypothetical protein